MADVSTKRAVAGAEHAPNARRRYIRLLPGILGALLFLALAAGDFLFGRAAAIQAALAAALAAAIAAQPPVFAVLRRSLTHAGLKYVVGAIGLAAALSLRVWGLGFGLPYLEHPDEWAVADRAVQMLRTADYSPHSFVYPTLYIYLELGVAAIHFLWGVGAGVYRSLGDIDPARYYLWARALTALLGTGAVLATYDLGRTLYGRAAGLLGAALLAVYPAAVGDAHYVTTDTPAMFFTMLAFLPIARLALQPPARPRDRMALTLIAGFAVGLATATKYNTVVLLAPLLAGIVGLTSASSQPSGVLRLSLYISRGFFFLLLALFGAGLGFTVGTPAWLRELPQMLNDLASVIVHYKFTGHPGAESLYPALFYWDEFMRNGWLLAWAFLGGTLLAFVRHSRADLLVLSFVAPYYLQMAGVKVVFFRNAMPLLPLLCLLAAALVVAVADLARKSHSGASSARAFFHRHMSSAAGRTALLAAVLLALGAEPLARSIHDNRLRAQPTTRILATRWVEEHAADGSRIWLEDQTLILPPRLRVQGGQPATTHDMAWYRAGNFRFLVVNEDVRRNDRDALAALGAPTARFDPAGLRHGPALAIYDIGAGDLSRDQRTPSGATLGGGAVALDGYQHPAEIKPGAILPLALYWRVDRSLAIDYTVYVHLLDINGAKVAQRDLPPLDGALPTTRWQPGELIRDDQDLPIPPTLPPGVYQLVVGMYDPKTLGAINDHGPIDVGVVVVR